MPPRRNQRGRPDIVAVGCRRSGQDQGQILRCIAQRRGQCRHFVVDDDFLDRIDAQRRQTRTHGIATLRQQRGFHPWRLRQNQSGRARLNRPNPQNLLVGQRCLGRFDRGLWRAIGNDLGRRNHLAGCDARIVRQGRQRQRLVQVIQFANYRGIDTQHACRFRVKIGAAREGGCNTQTQCTGIRRQGGCHAACSLVLGHVIVAGSCNDDGRNTALDQSRHIGTGNDTSLLQPRAIRQAQRMGQDRAFGLIGRNRSEFHAAASRVTSPGRVAGRRRRSVSSAITEIAISAGDFAPISSPTGASMRAICASEKPASVNRATRFPCVRVDPKAPM